MVSQTIYQCNAKLIISYRLLFNATKAAISYENVTCVGREANVLVEEINRVADNKFNEAVYWITKNKRELLLHELTYCNNYTNTFISVRNSQNFITEHRNMALSNTPVIRFH